MFLYPHVCERMGLHNLQDKPPLMTLGFVLMKFVPPNQSASSQKIHLRMRLNQVSLYTIIILYLFAYLHTDQWLIDANGCSVFFSSVCLPSSLAL